MQKICSFKKKTDCIFEFSTTKLGKNKCQYQCNKNFVPQCNQIKNYIVPNGGYIVPNRFIKLYIHNQIKNYIVPNGGYIVPNRFIKLYIHNQIKNYIVPNRFIKLYIHNQIKNYIVPNGGYIVPNRFIKLYIHNQIKNYIVPNRFIKTELLVVQYFQPPLGFQQQLQQHFLHLKFNRL